MQMKSPSFSGEQPAVRRAVEAPRVLRSLEEDSEKVILAKFTPEQQKEIRYRQQVLSSLAYFIGKDFSLPIKLGKPGSGWMWNFIKNIVFADPKDLLEKPLDYLRFVISHEAGHRRISRVEGIIPPEIWSLEGFAFMMNTIEDPRDNNFVAESYPKFREQMTGVYKGRFEPDGEAKEKAMKLLGRHPRFMQAGFEYMKLWFRELRGQDVVVTPELPDDVKAVVNATKDAARDSWLRYPSRQEADASEDIIKQYATLSYEINRDDVWPLFKTLVEKDIEDQKTQELLKQMQKELQKKLQEELEKNTDQNPEGPEEPENILPSDEPSNDEAPRNDTDENSENNEPSSDSGYSEDTEGEGAGGETTENASAPESENAPDNDTNEGKEDEPSVSSDLTKTLTPEEQKALEKAIEESLTADKDDAPEGSKGKAQAIDLDSLSPELLKKIQEFIETLPPKKQEELLEKAKGAIKEFEKEMNKALEGKLVKMPGGDGEPDEPPKPEEGDPNADGEAEFEGKAPEPFDENNFRLYKERIQKELQKDDNEYERRRREVLPLLDKLEEELRPLFVTPQNTAWEGGYATGKRIDIKKRIQETAHGVSAMESMAWQKREHRDEKKSAVILLVDISSSGRENKRFNETFKAVIALAEVFNRMEVPFEILGFDDTMTEYLHFGQSLSHDIREQIGGMPAGIEARCCKICGEEHCTTDLGWAISVAQERLQAHVADQKILFVLSDGKSAESPKHPRETFDIPSIITTMTTQSNIRPIGLGVGKGTRNIAAYLPRNMSNVTVEEMVQRLAGLVKSSIAEGSRF